MKNRPILRGLAGGAVALLFLNGMMVIAFFFTAFLYGRIGYQPSALLAQIVNSLLGFLFAFLILFAVGTFFKARQVAFQMGLFGPIIEAMEKIAKGDFTVRLDDDVRDNEVVGTLAKSVNNMALELNQMETMRQEFISNVSHEIQSPLTSIRGFARALQSEQLDSQERTHYLSIIETESMRLSKLSDNLLALASLDAKAMRFAPRPYRLDRQIREVILVCEPQWLEKALDLEIALDEVVISADEELLSQVWFNLAHNAIKFTPPGGSIRFALCQQESSAAVRITDTGIGIAEEDQAHIFERFFKADRSRQRARGGNGLGLAIVKMIIELHHGTISVESTPGAGSTFIVSLPLHSQPTLPNGAASTYNAAL